MAFDTRYAEIIKPYRKINRTEFKFGIEKIESQNCHLPTSIGVKWSLVIVGRNGVGKTSILNSLARCPSHNFVFSNLNLKCKIGTDFVYYNPSEETIKLRTVTDEFLGKESKIGILEQFEPLEMSSTDLEHINYILRTKFTSISVYEVSVSETEFPYVSVACLNERGTESLSHGELYCIHLYWRLFYKSEDNNVFIIDEPETYLDPNAQKRLLDIVLRSNNFKNSQIVFSTHSPVFSSNLKDGSVLKFFNNLDGTYDFTIEDVENSDLNVENGLSIPVVVFAEDHKGEIFLKLILNHLDYDCSGLIFKHVIGGASSFLKLHSLNMRNENDCKILFCFDADARSKGLIDKEIESYSLLLPGVLSPEEELKILIYNDIKYFLDFSFSKGISKTKLFSVLHEYRDENHHDFFLKTGEALGLGEFYFFEHAFCYWLSKPDNLIKSEDFIDGFNRYAKA